MDSFSIVSLLVVTAIISYCFGKRFPSWYMIKKIERAYLEKLALEYVLYAGGGEWTCIKRWKTDGGPFGGPSESILLERHGGKQRMVFSYTKGDIHAGSRVVVHLRNENDIRSQIYNDIFEDILIPKPYFPKENYVKGISN